MNIAVIVGTTREGRVTPRLARWILKRAEEYHADVTFTLLDLKDYNIPLLDEAPWKVDRTLTDGTKQWLDGLNQADGYIFVTAEYHRGIPAVLKNAIDYTNAEMLHKPALIASHGGVSGARSDSQLRLIINSSVGVVPIPANMPFHGKVNELIDEAGEPIERVELNETRLHASLKELVWYTNALMHARTENE